MIIRNKQIGKFQETADRDFINRVTNYIRGKHKDVFVKIDQENILLNKVSRDILQKLVSNGIRRARQYGITSESGLTSFVVIMFMVAPNFDEHPSFQKVLTNQDIEPNSRVDRLLNFTTEEDWETAKQQYDATAWKLDSIKD